MLSSKIKYKLKVNDDEEVKIWFEKVKIKWLNINKSVLETEESHIHNFFVSLVSVSCYFSLSLSLTVSASLCL